MSVSTHVVRFPGGEISLLVDVNLFALDRTERDALFEVLDRVISLGEELAGTDDDTAEADEAPVEVVAEVVGEVVQDPKPAPEPAPDPAENPGSTCPECGGTFVNDIGLGVHRSRKHGIKGGSAKPHRVKADTTVDGAAPTSVTLEQVAAAAKTAPAQARVWEHVAAELGVTHARARQLVIDARKAGLIPGFAESLGPIPKRPFDPDKVRAAQAEADR